MTSGVGPESVTAGLLGHDKRQVYLQGFVDNGVKEAQGKKGSTYRQQSMFALVGADAICD